MEHKNDLYENGAVGIENGPRAVDGSATKATPSL